MKIQPKLFAQMFVHMRNAEEAAKSLGVPPDMAKEVGVKILSEPKTRAYIKSMDSEDMQTLTYVKTGLTRLAFGQVNEAVRLVFDENVTAEQIMAADLFNVSEIKRVKGGGVEMKFADRQAALEKLVELDPELKDESDADKFIREIYMTNNTSETGAGTVEES